MRKHVLCAVDLFTHVSWKIVDDRQTEIRSHRHARTGSNSKTASSSRTLKDRQIIEDIQGQTDNRGHLGQSVHGGHSRTEKQLGTETIRRQLRTDRHLRDVLWELGHVEVPWQVRTHVRSVLAVDELDLFFRDFVNKRRNCSVERCEVPRLWSNSALGFLPTVSILSWCKRLCWESKALQYIHACIRCNSQSYTHAHDVWRHRCIQRLR